MDHLHIYLLAGVQTKDSAFITLTRRINQLLEQKGKEASITLLYPYGDYNRKLWKQVLDICIDFNFISKGAGIGGRRVKSTLTQALPQCGESSCKYLLIGHSGGGVAAYRLARYLHYKQHISLEHIRVVPIGSPKIRVASQFQSLIAYIQAVDEQGKLKDPITRIGHWGGLHLKRKENTKRWHANKYAPLAVHGIPLIGGHADYFRINAPFIDLELKSNLDYTFKVIESWLYEWI